MLIRLFATYCICLFGTYSSLVYSDWQLDKSQSELSFIAIKDARVADNHYFTRFDAYIDNNGQVKLTVDTESVQTNIAKRDQRLRDILFQVADFPQVLAQLKVRRSYLKSQPAGSQNIVKVKGHLNMLGISQPTHARLQVTHLANGQVSVNTIEPILVDSEDYGMLPGINALTKLAGLKTISIKIPVSFNLVFSLIN
jgi:polyisoprenoid-binding protein YceI